MSYGILLVLHLPVDVVEVGHQREPREEAQARAGPAGRDEGARRGWGGIHQHADEGTGLGPVDAGPLPEGVLLAGLRADVGGKAREFQFIKGALAAFGGTDKQPGSGQASPGRQG